MGGNTETDLKEMQLDSAEWIDLAQDRDKQWGLLNTVMNSKAGCFLTR
jgi:hypothetical protein